MSSQNDIICESCGKIYSYIGEKWCKPCLINNLKKNFTNWTSGNEKIDKIIQEIQSKINKEEDIIVEWIPYNQFNSIKKLIKDDFATAIWKDGSLIYIKQDRKRERVPNKEVTLKYLNNSQDVINDLLNEIKAYSIRVDECKIPKIHGISQNPDTKDYVIVFQNDCNCKECGDIYTDIEVKWCKPCQINNMKQNLANWTSGNEKIDEFIQEIQLNIEKDDIIIEWIPYNQFSDIKEIKKDDSASVYSAIWKNGLLKYNYEERKYKRNPNKNVTLMRFNNSQNIINDFLNEIKAYSFKLNEYTMCGISQNPDTNDYVIVFQNDCNCKERGDVDTDKKFEWCRPCQIIEWIPYNQFSIIEEISNGDFARVYLAKWKNGLLEYKEGKYKRNPSKEVTLKCLNNSQNVIDNLLNKVKSYSIKINEGNIAKIYGISQNPDTKDYVIVLPTDCKGGFATVYLATWNYRKVALKCLHNSQNITNEFLNEISAYSIHSVDCILKICGISQNPDTKDYIIVLEYANGGSLNNHNNDIIRDYNWREKLYVLSDIIKGLKKIHENKAVHRDFHTGNVLVLFIDCARYNGSGNTASNIYISDMGFCGEVSNIDKTKIYGVMPFVAPEVLRGKPYTQAADVYSFDNRPSASEVDEVFAYSSLGIFEEFNKQIKEADEYRKTNFLSIENSQSIHPQAYYTSRLLNPFTKDLSNDYTDCLDCNIND
ncbi:uncharacterized protein OCT59_005935 [Rhizophagus irregularis]|uniref:uncharacterized protein n=1 Tax=Rhizophagus irregularis TaxID=588596 RepID=UPI00331FEFB2|nr:hypothetical protein OCT59_005935 [Rhizophagus irregularis]